MGQLAAQNAITTPVKILFDASKAEMASNADWIIDADVRNLGPSGSKMVIGRGSESNPQQIPTPDQSGITASTSETYWAGAISSWGVACAKQGLIVETLPYNGRITYNDGTNTQDLSNYKVYVLDEPNIALDTAEKKAIIRWVKDGGGLFIISDHNNSDRNGDGIDSPGVLNDLILNNGIQRSPFGWTYDLSYFSETSSNYVKIKGNAVLNGPYGTPKQINISGGASMTITTLANPTVKALCYRSVGSGQTNVLVAQSYYGLGRVMGMTDSSPMDDGTGDPGDQLYFAWVGEVNGDHQRIMMNGTLWLAGLLNDSTATETLPTLHQKPATLGIYPNPTQSSFEVFGPEPLVEVEVRDVLGKQVLTIEPNADHFWHVQAGSLRQGTYFVEGRGISGQVYKGRVHVMR